MLKKKKQRAAPTELGPGQQWQRVFSLLERRLPNEILLAIPYLACFWLREPVLPTDIVRCGFCTFTGRPSNVYFRSRMSRMGMLGAQFGRKISKRMRNVGAHDKVKA